MSAHSTRRIPRSVAAGLATCAIALAAASPGLAAGPSPVGLAAAHDAAAQHQGPLGHPRSAAPTSSLAGTTESNLAARFPSSTPVSAPDEGATTLAVILIAAAAMAAGASAGFAGGRRVIRTH